MQKKFYEETGMYVDWKQLSKLPEIFFMKILI